MDPMELGPVELGPAIDTFESLGPVLPTVDLTELTELVRQLTLLAKQENELQLVLMAVGLVCCGVVLGCAVALILAVMFR